MHAVPAVVTRAIVALALVGAALGVAPGTGPTAPAEAAGVNEYSAPTWYPLRGSSKVGCTWSNGCSGHHSYFALDLLQAKGSPVYAAGAGKLTIKGTATACSSAAGYGTWVEVDHGGGVTTRYAHLSKITVANGSWVDQTTKIGEVGATGNVVPCTANHLHYEQRRNGTLVAPNSLKGCNGTTYPNTWGTTSWSGVTAHQKTVTNTTSCSSTPPPTDPGPKWETVAGSLVQIEHGPRGEIWGIDAQNRLLQYAGLGTWTVRGEGYRHVTIGQAADAGGPNVYALTTSGAIRRTRNNTTFEHIKGTLVQIDHGPDGEIWGVNAAGNLYRYAGHSKWTKIGEGYRHVSTGAPAVPGRPTVYALTSAGGVRASVDHGATWRVLTGTLVQLDLGPTGKLWGVNAAGQIYERTSTTAWTARGSGFRNVSIGQAADAGGPFLYAVTTAGTIRRLR